MNHGSALYRQGVSYYAHGTIKQGRNIYGYFYKLSKPATEDQLKTLHQEYPHLETMKSRKQYAPEIVADLLVFPSKAQLKRNLKK